MPEEEQRPRPPWRKPVESWKQARARARDEEPQAKDWGAQQRAHGLERRTEVDPQKEFALKEDFKRLLERPARLEAERRRRAEIEREMELERKPEREPEKQARAKRRRWAVSAIDAGADFEYRVEEVSRPTRRAESRLFQEVIDQKVEEGWGLTDVVPLSGDDGGFLFIFARPLKLHLDDE
jgi:hypothetical protein